MRNADQPAMPVPLTDIQAEHISEYNRGLRTNGLTKREMMAMHIMAGVLVGVDSPEIERCASLAVTAADALLLELGLTK